MKTKFIGLGRQDQIKTPAIVDTSAGDPVSCPETVTA